MTYEEDLARDVARVVEQASLRIAADVKHVLESQYESGYNDALRDCARLIIRWRRPWDAISIKDAMEKMMHGYDNPGFCDPEINGEIPPLADAEPTDQPKTLFTVKSGGHVYRVAARTQEEARLAVSGDANQQMPVFLCNVPWNPTTIGICQCGRALAPDGAHLFDPIVGCAHTIPRTSTALK